jgi:hypothetical protein
MKTSTVAKLGIALAFAGFALVGCKKNKCAECHYEDSTNAEVEIVGREWGIHQSKELKEAGVPCIHYYTMSNSSSVKAIAKEIF